MSHIENLDFDIDYKLLSDTFYQLDLDNLLDTDPFQIAIQKRPTVTDRHTQMYESCGSLYYDWPNRQGSYIPLRKDVFEETEFVELCDYLKDTYIEEVFNLINDKYPVCRGRFMKSFSKTCLSYHKDLTKRIHIPIYTNENCFMVIEDKVNRLYENNVYMVDTTVPHTAINASKHSRVHIVFCLYS